MADLKRDMAILATSGRDWADRTKRLAARVPGLDIFSQGLVVRESGGWKITSDGRAVLEFMEARPVIDEPLNTAPAENAAGQVPPLRHRPRSTPSPRRRRCRRQRLQGQGDIVGHLVISVVPILSVARDVEPAARVAGGNRSPKLLDLSLKEAVRDDECLDRFPGIT